MDIESLGAQRAQRAIKGLRSTWEHKSIAAQQYRGAFCLVSIGRTEAQRSRGARQRSSIEEHRGIGEQGLRGTREQGHRDHKGT